MAKVLTDNKHYTDIADAIRAKNGTQTTYKPSEMADAITVIESGGADLPEEAFLMTGAFNYKFFNGGWDWFINNYGQRVTTTDITDATFAFSGTGVEYIPFELNFKSNLGDISFASIFANATRLREIPKINQPKPGNMSNIFQGCANLRYLPEDIEYYFNWTSMDAATSMYAYYRNGQFDGCRSLRSVPMGFLKHGNRSIGYSSSYLYNGFRYCNALEELVDLPLPFTATWTTNAFSSTFEQCCMLKNIIFSTNEDGQPDTKNWKNQTIDLTRFVGYSTTNLNGDVLYVFANNSGLSTDKVVSDDATYQALKNEPDWIAAHYNYSRYNHDSAVATINSLPDTSAYLATAGGTNTIKFQGVAGSLTDGGAINTLTEEEIAVATAKGWTVTFA